MSAKIFLVMIQITARLELPLIETLDSLLQIESHGLHQAQDNEMLSARDNHLLVHFKTEQIVIWYQCLLLLYYKKQYYCTIHMLYLKIAISTVWYPAPKDPYPWRRMCTQHDLPFNSTPGWKMSFLEPSLATPISLVAMPTTLSVESYRIWRINW